MNEYSDIGVSSPDILIRYVQLQDAYRDACYGDASMEEIERKVVAADLKRLAQLFTDNMWGRN